MRYLIIAALALLAGGFFFTSPVSAATTYYVDATYGSDSNGGTSTSDAWKTIGKVNAKSAASCSSNCLAPGDTVMVMDGGYFNDATLLLGKSGTVSNPITIKKYDNGTDPIIAGHRPCVDITGNWIVLEGIATINCYGSGQYGLGVEVEGDNNVLDGGTAAGNMVGISIKGGADDNQMFNYDVNGNQQGDGTGSSGVGLLLHGARNIIAASSFSNNYWADPNDNNCRHGAAIEIFGGDGENADDNVISYNLGVNNEAFSELGVSVNQNGTPKDHTDDTRNGTADGTIFAYNVIRGNLAGSNCGSTSSCTSGLNGLSGIITRGDGNTENVSPGSGTAEYGPVLDTTILNTSIYFAGSCSQGIVCSGACMRDNVIDIKNTVAHTRWKGAFIGNKYGTNTAIDSWDGSKVDYSSFFKDFALPGSSHCQFQGTSCTALTHGFIGDDPKMVSTTDLRPKCASEGGPSHLIDAGVSVSGFNADFVGTSVPQGSARDIGAYERVC